MERKALVKYVLSPFMSVVSRQVVENCSLILSINSLLKFKLRVIFSKFLRFTDDTRFLYKEKLKFVLFFFYQPQARDHDKVILKVASQQPLRKSYLRVLFLAPKKTLIFLKCVDLQRYSETNN